MNWSIHPISAFGENVDIFRRIRSESDNASFKFMPIFKDSLRIVVDLIIPKVRISPFLSANDMLQETIFTYYACLNCELRG